MTKTCKYPDKPCNDYFIKTSTMTKMCRLTEWKKKIGVCPYDSSIHSTPKKLKASLINKTQQTL